MSIRLDGATLVDPAPDGPKVIPEANVLIEDGRIREIGQATPEAEHVIDATDHLACPGLVNAHTHTPMTLLRGAADGLELDRWLKEVIWPAEANLTQEAVAAGARLAIAEMIASGTTAFADMYLFMDAVAQAAQDAGIRCLAGFTLTDAGTPEHPPDQLLDACDDFLSRWPAEPGALVHGSVAPHATYTCGPDTLQAAARLSEDHGAILQTHCSETRHEVYTVEQDTGRRPLAQLAHHGCLTDRSVIAHCGWMTKAEARTLAQAGATPVHNPVANMKLATGGYAPVPELLQAGAPLALGTDGPASNNRLDMIETMKATSLVHMHHRWQADLLQAGDVLHHATGATAQLFGLEQAGRLVEGAPADVILVDTARPHLQPLNDPVSHLVYAARGGDVTTTIVAGQLVYHGGEHLTLEPGQVMAEARQAAGTLLPGQDRDR